MATRKKNAMITIRRQYRGQLSQGNNYKPLMTHVRANKKTGDWRQDTIISIRTFDQNVPSPNWKETVNK